MYINSRAPNIYPYVCSNVLYLYCICLLFSHPTFHSHEMSGQSVHHIPKEISRAAIESLKRPTHTTPCTSLEDLIHNCLPTVDPPSPADPPIQRTPKSIADRRKKLYDELVGTSRPSPALGVRRTASAVRSRIRGGISASHVASMSFAPSKQDLVAIDVLLRAYNNVLPALSDAGTKKALDEVVVRELIRRVANLYEAFEGMREEVNNLARSYQQRLVEMDAVQSGMNEAEKNIIARAIDQGQRHKSVLEKNIMVFSTHKTGEAPFRGIYNAKRKK